MKFRFGGSDKEFEYNTKGETYGRLEIDRLRRDDRVLVEVIATDGSEDRSMTDLSADDAIAAGEALIKAGRLAKGLG